MILLCPHKIPIAQAVETYWKNMRMSSFKEAFSLEKSNGELRKQFITTGAVQLDGEKLTDPMADFHANAGQILRLSKKQSIRLV